jgi:predicted nuclease of predicted toxin-antitoxin system
MKFVVDAQLPPALARLLNDQGHDAVHVADVGLLAAKGTAITAFALQEKAVIVSKDEDFPHRLSQISTGPAILWLRIGNSTRRALLEWIEPLLPQIVAQFEAGEHLVEVIP